ncbi:DUF1127 domain-containing protein [Falsiroseomonas oryzae]|uniref:DUF1127 domain-containing protein n=1 Tax=Falsiroseomonas oryzae TaxID=2766473 RepID=UPI0022EADECE|nr:DUF1127 domain-containing protein [Roseomonas sp. MO-31]
MSGTALSRPVARAARGAVRPAGWLAWLARALHAIETRRRLAEMDDRMLKDIGITRADALQEASRAPWDLARSAPWHMR